jgi:hypothetical protein
MTVSSSVFQTKLETHEGRMELAREYVEKRAVLFEGMEVGTPEAARINDIYQRCQPEIAAAFIERDEMLARERREKLIASIPSVIRVPYRAFQKLGEALCASANKKTIVGVALIIAALMFYMKLKSGSSRLLSGRSG